MSFRTKYIMYKKIIKEYGKRKNKTRTYQFY